MRRRRGFLLIDAVTALVVVGILGVALAMTLHHHHRAERALSDGRTALRLAERALVMMQYEQTRPRSTEQTIISVRPIPDAPAVEDDVWVTVTVEYADRRAEVIGLAPIDVMLQR